MLMKTFSVLLWRSRPDISSQMVTCLPTPRPCTRIILMRIAKYDLVLELTLDTVHGAFIISSVSGVACAWSLALCRLALRSSRPSLA